MAEPGRTAPAASTIAAGVVGLAVTLPFLYRGVMSGVQAARPDSVDSVRSSLVQIGVPAMESEASVLYGLMAVVLLIASVTALVLTVGVLLRRGWAREGAIGLFGIFALLALASGLRGITADPPAPNASWALLTGVADVAIVLLLLRRTTVRDFQVAALSRSRTGARQAA
jgi:hypothetical protein